MDDFFAEPYGDATDPANIAVEGIVGALLKELLGHGQHVLARWVNQK